VAKYCDEPVCLLYSVCVCVSVCLFARISPESHALSLPIFCGCCLWPLLGPPLAGWRNPKGKGQFWGFFLPHWQCIVQHSLWDSYKNGRTDRDAVWDDDSDRPKVPCVTWRTRSPKRKGAIFFGGGVKSTITSLSCLLQKGSFNR